MTTGIDKAREVADKLKGETAEQEKVEEKNKQIALNQLAAIKNNPDLVKMYEDNAEVGAENLSGSLPLLKVHAVGKSQNLLSDGSEPADGAFFYKPTGEQFKEIDVHILTISEGFRATGMEGSNRDDVFNQILGGVILDGTEYKPFIMYFTGKKLANLWEFGKEAKKYTRGPKIKIPMFALTVNLSTEKVDNSIGKSWIVNFKIVMNEDGDMPKLITDPGEFQFLKDSVETIKSTIDSIVLRKANASQVESVIPLKESEDSEPVDPDNIPF